MKYIIISVMTYSCLLVSCSNQAKAPLNPNGDSELALLMRQMFEDGMEAKQAVLDDKKLTSLRHKKILTAEATDPEKAQSDIFTSLAHSYLELADQVNDSKKQHRKEAYSNLVNSCIQCHKALCPGPLVRIEKMVLE